MIRVLFLSILICFFSGIDGDGSDPEKNDFSFRRISPVGGFTYGAISTIGEDSTGFIWFGTTHGLYRYNTAEVIKFMNDPKDSTTLPNNSIRTIFCDAKGTLWIGTSNGLCTYDNTRDKFVQKRFRDKSGDSFGTNIYEILKGEGTTIYLLSSVMLGKLNIETDQFEKVVEKSSDENFSCAVYDLKSRIWIGGSDGTVWLYDLSNYQTKKIVKHRAESIRKIFADEKGIWIAYNWAGLDFTGTDGSLIAHYGSNPDDSNKIHHNRVRDIYKDESGMLWISTYKGISFIDKGTIINMQPQEITGLPYQSIYRIFRDSKKGIWIGTWSGGLAYRSNYDNRFIHSRKDQAESEVDDEFVSSFAEKNDGTILIATEFGNLNKLLRSSNKMINIPIKTENGKKIENIKSLLFDKKKETLWVGTFLDGLWYQLKNENVFRQIKGFKDPRASVYALEKSDSGLWIGTFGNGLYHFNEGSGNMMHYLSLPNDTNTLSNNSIRSLLITGGNNLWVGTNNGFNSFNPLTGKFHRFKLMPGSASSINSEQIFTLHCDKTGMIWIGTGGGGINKYNPETKTFVTFGREDGLAGDDVYGIEEDKNGMLWISTDNGITNIDPVSNSFRNFYREDELQGNQFNPGAVFQTSSGEILFGDTKGFTYFTPDKINTNPYPPEVVFTSLLINNIPVNIHTPNSPLKTTLQTESELKLSHHQNSLVFSFVANNFLLPDKNRFKYRLTNYDKDWVNAGTQNYATYTKIPPGKYVLEVIACNNDNLWNNSPTQLKISISPPLWLSGYAYLFYSVVLVLAFYFIRKSVLDRQRFKKELLLERLINESESKIHEMKMQFVTNISHEFRTPLTLISSPVNLLLEKYKMEPVVREYLQTIQRNSNRLLQLIKQFIDVQRIELGKAAFHPVKTDLIQLCREVLGCFEMEAKDKHIHVSFIPEAERLYVNLDPEKADKILFNILSNAMKFTGENGTVEISVYTTQSDENSAEGFKVGEAISGNTVSVEISDNGPGIVQEEISLIFDRFEQGKNHQSSGTGIGLHMAYEYIRMHHGNIHVKSKTGSGSTFTISFPLTESFDHTKESEGESDTLAENDQPVIRKSDSVTLSEKDKTVTILIIEDNHELRHYLKRLLHEDYRIVTASNGKQGLETALTIIPDLVITDILMPQLDGFEVCRHLKTDIRSSHIPVIILTALNNSEKQIDGLMTGADAYITKPFDENILVAQIENLIQSRAKLKKVFSVSDIEWINGMELLSSDRMLINKATSIIEQHLNDKTFVVDNLAAQLGISTSTFYRKLRVLTNQSPTEFIRYIRLRKAINLMDEGNTNVEEISFAVGFNSHSYFSSSFKKQFGKTPSNYLSDLKSKISSGEQL